MAALHDALKTLGPLDISEAPTNDLKPFLSDAFSNGQLIVDSVPLAAPADGAASPDARSRANSSASSASEISLSAARSAPPPSEIEALQKEWKQVKLNPKENPLGMSVYKLGGKDGKGAWFARRSVHEGLGFTKWKKGLEREFPETMKVQGGPGEGNIRGIGGERRVEYKNIDGVGKMEVYLLSAQFPGPTTPRDFVTMVITSDQALTDRSGGEHEVPRHYMVISRPCNHPDTPARDGFIRGRYESVEFIREIPIHKSPRKSSSTTNLPGTRARASSSLGKEAILRNAQKTHSTADGQHNGTMALEDDKASNTERSQGETRARGKTISFDKSRGSDAKGEGMDVPRVEDDSEANPIEWIMITRSDPGGSVPRFMIERGTPGGIVSDASKFLDWACAKDIQDLESDDEGVQTQNSPNGENTHKHDHRRDLHDYQTNGHLAGIEEGSTPTAEVPKDHVVSQTPANSTAEQPAAETSGGLYGMVANAAGAASTFVASHTPHIIADNLPGSAHEQASSDVRRESTSSISSASSAGSFASALENYGEGGNDASSIRTTDSATRQKFASLQDKELQKLEEKKRKVDEKLSKTREKELSKKSEDTAKEEEAIKKAEEKHEREKQRQEEKYRKEVEKLEKKREKEEMKVLERRKKAVEKDEKTKLLRELEEVKAEVGMLRKEKEILSGQVGDLQAENTALALRVGRLGAQGEEVLRDLRAETGRTGRLRASSMKGLVRPASLRSSGSGDKESVTVGKL